MAKKMHSINTNLKGIIKDDYKKENPELKAFKLHKMGRFENEVMLFSMKFQLDGLVKKAGPNYILEAGNFIGSQREIEEKHLKREVDVFLSSPRSFKYDIVLTIPDGYLVEGIENLTKSVDNATGGFQSVAKVEGNQLKIKVEKWYNHNFEKAKDWDKVLAFLQAANDFTSEKVLLKKQ